MLLQLAHGKRTKIYIYMLIDASTVHYASQAFRIVTGVFMDVQVNGNLRVPPRPSDQGLLNIGFP